MTRLVSIGEALWDRFPDGDRLGGAPLNFAVRVRELGAESVFVSAVGNDELGARAIAEIAARGIATNTIAQLDHPTGSVDITLDEQRNPSYVIVPNVAYDHIEANDAVLEAAGGASCLAYGTLAQRAPESRAAIHRVFEAAADVPRFYDVNLRPECYTEAIVRDSLEAATMAKLNRDEAVEFAAMFSLEADTIEGATRAIATAFSLDLVVVTLGEHGALVVTRDGREAYHPGYRVTVQDPCGAGDAFSAAFVLAVLAGGDPGEALARANALGAIVASQRGATDPVDPARIETFMKEAKRREPLLTPLPLT